MYARGEGVPENAAEAMKWQRLAAGQGHADGTLDIVIQGKRHVLAEVNPNS